jgi:HK97 family phage major capsid protein
MSENVKTIEEAVKKVTESAQTAAKAAADAAVADVKKVAEDATAEATKAMEEVGKMALELARLAGGDGGRQEEVKGSFLRFVEKEQKEAGKDGKTYTIAQRLKAIKNTGQSFTFEIDEKAALDILTPGPLVGGPLPERREGIQGPLDDLPRVVNYIPSGTTGSPSHQYVRELSVIGGPGMVGEGELKPGMAITTEMVTAPVRKIAVTLHLSEEVLDDMPRFVSYLQARANTAVSDLKDAQLLFGDGTGNNLIGVSTLAQPFSAGPLRKAGASNVDVLRAGVAQVRRLKEKCTAIFANPDDIAQMELDLDAAGRPILTSAPGQLIATIGRIPVIELDAVPVGSFLMGNFAGAAQYFERKGRTVKVYDQNGTDAEHNMVLVIIEERGVLEVYRNKSFVKGTYAAGKAALAAPAANA